MWDRSIWKGQAREVLDLEAGFEDPHNPLLIEVHALMDRIQAFVFAAGRTPSRSGAFAILDDHPGKVKVWFDGAGTNLIGFAVQADYGSGWENPLPKYQ